jgi:2-polyprenyl-3-methyl-5-hydroxy-6-metoxy-1,4-benzoquinol methylase
MISLSERIEQEELMDTEFFSLETMKETLKFLSFTNRYFGGNRVILDKLTAWSKNWKQDELIDILDIGTGGGDIPIAISQWAFKNKFNVRITGIDLMKDIVEIANENVFGIKNILIEQKDFYELEKSPGSFDYVVASLFLHHTPVSQSIQTLQLMNSISRRGIILSDLHRTWPSYISVKLLSNLIGNHVVKHDGPLSVQRSFHVKELQDLAEKSGITFLKAQKEPWFRLSLSGEKK